MKPFRLEILTLERVFFQGETDSLIVETPGGKFGVLADHEPVVAALEAGEIRFRQNDEWKVCVSAQGFMDVSPQKVVIMSQVVEWPEEIDERLVQEEVDREAERLRQKQSLWEYEMTRSSMARALARLRVTKSNNYDR